MREYGSEHPAIVLPDRYFEKLSELRREVLFLRSGREALLLTALKGIEVERVKKVLSSFLLTAVGL